MMFCLCWSVELARPTLVKWSMVLYGAAVYDCSQSVNGQTLGPCPSNYSLETIICHALARYRKGDTSKGCTIYWGAMEISSTETSLWLVSSSCIDLSVSLVDFQVEGFPSRLHHVCQGGYVAMHKINFDGGERKICCCCVGEI